MTDGQISEPGSPANQSFRSTDSGASSPERDLGAMAGDAVSKLTQVAQQAGTQAKETATSLASEAGEIAKGIFKQQVGSGADLVGHIAQSVGAAADRLDHDAPKTAELVRSLGKSVEVFSDTVRDQTVEELYETASDFVRRNPAVVFSAAAACGFMLFRLLRAGPSNGSSANRQQDPWPRQPQGNEGDRFQSGGGPSQTGF